MIYVVGTGRCGTQTLARLLGGVHEPDPHIIREANEYYQGRHAVLPGLAAKLRARAALPTPAVSDHKQSTVIPLILEIDPTARFVMLVRQPLPGIASFLHRGWYGGGARIWERCRLRPAAGFPRNWTQAMKCGWLWTETYRVILNALGTRHFFIVFTHELGERVWNSSRRRPPELQLDRRERRFFRRSVEPLWEEIVARREAQPPGDALTALLKSSAETKVE